MAHRKRLGKIGVNARDANPLELAGQAGAGQSGLEV
jgi:hypothetical protein